MPRSNALAFAAGGLVIVALSFGAGMLGGSLGSSPAGDTAAPAPRSVPDTVVRSRLDELDRRLSNVEERLRVTEETAQAALDRGREIDALRRAIDELRGARTAPAEVAPAPESTEPQSPGGDVLQAPMTPEARAALEDAQREKLKADAQKIVLQHAPALMKQRLARIADATAQGEADRRSQLYAETKQLAVQYRMTPDEETRLREILVEEAESSVREVAPYLGGGLDRADYGAVKQKLQGIWDHRDAQMAEVLDEKELKEYQESQKWWRKVYEKVLDDMDAARLNR